MYTFEPEWLEKLAAMRAAGARKAFSRLAKKMQVGPCIPVLGNWEYSYKGLKLAQLLAPLKVGACLTPCGRSAALDPRELGGRLALA